MPKCLSTLKQKGEEVRKFIYERQLLDISYKIKGTDNRLLIPIKRELTEEEHEQLKQIDPSFSIINERLPKAQVVAKSLLETLSKILPKDELALTPRSFDTIGDLVVIEIPDKLWEKRKIIGEALIQTHTNIKAVYAKLGKVEGVNRVRTLARLVGEKRTKTIHREYGVRLAVDIAKAYFSPRLSEEHVRVARQVKKGEIVVDLFCGVGPFVIPITNRVEATVYAIDINPEAITLLRESLTLNKLQGKIIPFCGDCRKIVEEENLRGIADRAIMNLPGYAIEFIDVVCKVIKATGGIIHFFQFTGGNNPEETVVENLAHEVERHGRKVIEVFKVKKVRMSAPRQWQMVVDAKII